MNLILGIPLIVRLAAIFMGGALVGSQINRGIYRLAWNPRAIGPWSERHKDAAGRRWYDRVPIVGWFFLSRESVIHGRLYWVRPCLIEMAMAVGFAALYWYEMDRTAVAAVPGFLPAPTTLHAQYFSHVILISLMMVATFIDFDEQTIPDAITELGAFTGFLLAAVLPISRPFVSIPAVNGFKVEHLHLASGNAWPAVPSWPGWLNEFWGLVGGLLAFFAWWVATLPWLWTTRQGLRKAWQYFFASISRHMSWFPVFTAVVASVTIVVTWRVGGDCWESLLSSLTGAVFGGAMIWAVRIVGTRALGQEAMGFGDVTLMAMIGAYQGWQATLLAFFLAPFAALVISVTQFLVTGRKDIAFGPYLCLGAFVLLLEWDRVWENLGQKIFGIGIMLPILLGISIPMIWALLTLWSFIRGVFVPER